MAEADPIKRIKASARRASGPVNIETQRNWYLEELETELGRKPVVTGDQEAPRGDGFFRFVLKMLLLAALVFGATSAVMLWRAGALDRFFPAAAKVPGDRPWTIIDEVPPPPPSRGSERSDEKDAPPNQIEPLLHPPVAKAPAQDAPQPEADPAE